MNRNEQETLKIWERKTMKRILGRRKTEDGYVSRINEKVHSNIHGRKSNEIIMVGTYKGEGERGEDSAKSGSRNPGRPLRR